MNRKTLYEAQQAILAAALDILRYERALVDDSPPLGHLKRAEDQLAAAASDLVIAVDGLPWSSQPKGWDER
jgi:hypothetical protein